MNRTSPSRKQLDRLGTLLLAFVLAVVVWVVSVQQENPVQTMTLNGVPVQVVNLPDTLMFADNGASDISPVDVRVRAPRNISEMLSVRDLEAYIDLSNAQTGRQEVKVQVDPKISGVDIVGKTPEAIVVRLEQIVENEVPVIANVIDSPPFGYTAGAPVITPTTVLVSGPQSQVEAVQQAEVTVRLRDANSDVKIAQLVTLRDGDGAVVTGLTVEPRTVTVVVPIEQKQGFAEKSVRPNIIGQPAANYAQTGITVEPTTVTIFGDPETLAQLPGFVETTPINIDGATDTVLERAPLIIPETVSIVAAQAVTVTINIEPIYGSLTMTLKPVVQGLGAELQVESISPTSIDVLLVGPQPRLNTLKANTNVRAVLGLANLEEGVYPISPILIVPDDVTVQSVLPEAVQVTIVRKLTPTPGQSQ
jgi:YbbR domain-containing protein